MYMFPRKGKVCEVCISVQVQARVQVRVRATDWPDSIDPFLYCTALGKFLFECKEGRKERKKERKDEMREKV